MLAYSIAQSALSVSQQVLDLIGQNLANANTPGYRTQTANLVELVTGGVGSGVAIGSVTNNDSPLIDSAVTKNVSESASTGALLQPLQQIEALLTPNSASLDTQLSKLQSDVTQLTAQPDNGTQRATVIGDLSQIASTLNGLSENLDRIRAAVGSQAGNAVTQVNQLAKQIATLNGQIQNFEIQGQSANDLVDQRDELINQLAQFVDVRTVARPYGVTDVVGAGVPLVVSDQSYGLRYGTDASGNAVITALNLATPVTVAGGQLQGLLQAYNQTVPGYGGQLDSLAAALAQQVDGVQATGVGTSGPLTAANGSRGVNSATASLSAAGTQFPVQDGTLYVGVTDLSTGQRTLDPVTVTPATQSLQDVAAAITAATGGQVQVTVDATNDTLQFAAQPGFAFDFTGQPPTSPALGGTFAGTTTPTLSGVYTGPANDTYTFQVQGAGGTVGTTPNLTVQVLDAANNVVATLAVGSGYTPGTPLAVANGLSVAFSAGTFTAGGFSYPVIARPDTSGLLTALGVNTAFTGNAAGNLAVNPALLGNPASLSAALTGQPGDGSNLQRLLATLGQPVLAGGTQTVAQFYSGIVGGAGTQVQQAQDQQTAQQALAQQLQGQQQAVSGVDTNEQLLRMLEFQRSYQFASSYVTAVNNALNSLLNIPL